MEAFFDWLERRPHRWHIANVVMITCILALIDSPDLMGFIGALALAMLALFGAIAARRAMSRIKAPAHAFDLMLLWLPGAFAFGMAAAGLLLAVTGDMPWLGLPIFAIHAALLVRIASDQIEGCTVLTTESEAA